MSADLKTALQNAELLYTHEAIKHTVGQMADGIGHDYRQDAHAPLFLTVMNGALPFAGALALALGARGLDLQLDYLHATRYRGDTRGQDLHWLRQPTVSLAGRRVLLVDDILDEGQTLLEVKRWCEAQGAQDVRIAVLAVKRHDRCVPGIQADYIGLEVPDRYVFGYGMDYHEQGRNLPAIYALND
ncbi:hypoxanthine-guanine phosphoribosyltransferase [Lysobacteraceae bacterium NML120232]|nr:hypoxanthine-guanine phosphoribosyltransferase [Xanthomonadaceae bacterium NML120232]